MPITLTQPHGLTAVAGKADLAIAGANTTYTISAFDYSINGKAYAKAAVTGSNGVTPTTDVNTGAAFTALAADKGCVFVWGVNAAGTVQVAQGEVADIDGTADTFLDPAAPLFPYIPDTMVPFAYSVHQTTGASSAWTIGTSNWNATGLTDIPVDVLTLPSRPPTDATA